MIPEPEEPGTLAVFVTFQEGYAKVEDFRRRGAPDDGWNWRDRNLTCWMWQGLVEMLGEPIGIYPPKEKSDG